ncbi:EKA-like protein [Blumeria hordei DH14]|uniref:EKA-like protein n=1 Tax=Blumeria graminis f. sp. hordei (strain DH14) TaxID=546991 RepID=N1J615_BLUG1|nr:EKA-like protein [Blumeria hordei DH14]
MPPVRKKRPTVLLDNTRPPKCAEMSKVSTKGKEKALPTVAEPDTDMIGSVEIIEEIPQRASTPYGIGESSKSPPTALKPSENAAPKADCPQNFDQLSKLNNDAPPKQRQIWLRSHTPPFDQRVKQIMRRLDESLLTHCHCAIHGYGPGLPPRPANPPPRAPDARSPILPAVLALPVKSTWAMVAKNGLPQKADPIAKAVPRPVAKASKKDAPKAKVNKQLFIRLGGDHPWRA